MYNDRLLHEQDVEALLARDVPHSYVELELEELVFRGDFDFEREIFVARIDPPCQDLVFLDV